MAKRTVRQCLVWMSIAEEPLNKDYSPYPNKIRIEFARISLGHFTILKEENLIYSGQEDYESRVCAVKFDVAIPQPDFESADKMLYQRFCAYHVSEGTPALFLEILKYKEESADKRYDTFFDSIRIKDFGIGHLSLNASFECNFRYGKHYNPSYENGPRVTLELDTEKLCIDFLVSNDGTKSRITKRVADTTEVHRLEIAFRDLSYYILVDARSNACMDLYFLNTMVPLQLWRTKDCHTSFRYIHSERTRWIRTCSLKTSRQNLDCRLTRQVLGNSSTFCISLPMKKQKYSVDPRDLIASLEQQCGFAVEYIGMRVNYVEPDPHAVAPHLMKSVENGEETELIDWNIAALFRIGFRMHEQVRFKSFDDDEDTFFEALVRQYSDIDEGPEQKRKLENALSQTFDVMSSVGIDPHFLLVDRVLYFFLMQQAEKNIDDIVPPSCRLVKRILLTPSRVVVLPPSLQHDNRILREFDHRYAVSVSFQNEDASRFDNSSTRDYVYNAVGKPLIKGIQVAGKNYEYLACSASQLREQGCWLYAEDPQGNTASDIRSWMGDLHVIKHPGRKLSRMGQCFSDSVEVAVNISGIVARGCYMRDIETPDGKYTFSDGIGKISLEMLKEVCTDNRVANHNGEIPSALQIRFGGCKGMLALDPRLEGKTFELRVSMFKFVSNHTKLEINKVSAPTPLMMNKQVITLLSQVNGGVPDRVFIQLLCQMMHRYADCLLEERMAVLKLGDSGFSCKYSDLHQNGFQFTTDIFFRRMLTVVTRSKIEGIRGKARIEIPPDYGRTMLGVLDEFGVLEYGQIFVQYSADINEPGLNKIIHEGTTVVAKMPGLFPGDIRKFEAMNHKELHHLLDVVVFPSKGKRPHPNEISGSDLDGDEYWVTWLPDLIFSEENEEPFDFPSGKKPSQEHNVTLSELVNFMVDFAANDKVGQIANAHLAWADRTDIHSEECLNLAKIHSHVIDFAKTGFLPEEIRDDGLIQLLPEAYPDFMDKADHKATYRSEKVLGKIYRVTKKCEISVGCDANEETKQFEMTHCVDIRLSQYGRSAEYHDKAEKLYETYKSSLNRVMRRYGIQSEEELIGSAIVSKSTTRNTYTRTEDRHDLDKLLVIKVDEIKKNIRSMFHQDLEKAFGGKAPIEAKLSKASACYFVAYVKDGVPDLGKKIQNQEARRSFPWLFSEYMVQILQRCPEHERQLYDSCLLNLSEKIDQVSTDVALANCKKAGLMAIAAYPDDNLAYKTVSVLIDWAIKWDFIGEASSVKIKCKTFGRFLITLISNNARVNELFNTNQTGPLLIAFLRAITDLPDIQNDPPILPKTLQDLKISALIAHYQLARYPDISALTARHQSQGKRVIDIQRSLYASLKSEIPKLVDEFKENFNVSVQFRKNRKGGRLQIVGPGISVEDFYEYWIERVSGNMRRAREIQRRREDPTRFSDSEDETENPSKAIADLARELNVLSPQTNESNASSSSVVDEVSNDEVMTLSASHALDSASDTYQGDRSQSKSKSITNEICESLNSLKISTVNTAATVPVGSELETTAVNVVDESETAPIVEPETPPFDNETENKKPSVHKAELGTIFDKSETTPIVNESNIEPTADEEEVMEHAKHGTEHYDDVERPQFYESEEVLKSVKNNNDDSAPALEDEYGKGDRKLDR